MARKKWMNASIDATDGDVTIATIGNDTTALLASIKLEATSTSNVTIKIVHGANTFESTYQVTAGVPYTIDDKIVIESDGVLKCATDTDGVSIYVSGVES
jgi:serine phosphatase RsbU (regulator of sigma subunit)